ncbi:MAG: CDGSH iron-sulfur domain-containing protein [Magnetovibrionaceae bacterium]
MSEPTVAATDPFEIEVEAGKYYAWCACGLSKKQPLCDGAHSTCDIRPLVFKAEKSETVWLCGCKKTKTPPFCDGSHSDL